LICTAPLPQRAFTKKRAHCRQKLFIILSGFLLFTAGAEDRSTLIRRDLARMEMKSPTKGVKALRDLNKGGASALVVLARELNPEQCSELKRQTDEVRKFGLAVTIAQIPKAAACPEIEAEVSSSLAGELRRRETSAAAVLVLDGDDGAETTYVGIKTLAGISTRMTGEKILDGGEQFGLVPISSWSQSDRDVLMQFIRGL